MTDRLAQITVRRGTTAQWTAANPTLAEGEIGLDTTLDQAKIGDGVTAWATLPFSTLKPADITDLTDGGNTTLHKHNAAEITSGTISGITDLAVADGGTGASSFAAAGLPCRAGAPVSLTTQTGNIADQTLLAANHTAGFYRIDFHLSCTKAGTTGDLTYANAKFSDGNAHATTVQLNNNDATITLPLTNTNKSAGGAYTFYSDGSAAITAGTWVGTYAGAPEYSFRARLTYLGT